MWTLVACLLLVTPSAVSAAVQSSASPSSSAPLQVWSAVSAGPMLERFVEIRGMDGVSEVRIVTDATSRIVPQIAAGAPADVVVTADRAWMLEAAALGIVDAEQARRVALNRLVLISSARDGGRGGAVTASETAGTTTLDTGAVRAFLAAARGPDPVLALAGPDVPVGRYAREALGALGLTGAVDHRVVAVGNARAVVNAVAVGEVALGIGYASDVVADPAIRVLGYLPPESYGRAEIWAAPVLGADHPRAAEFVSALAAPSRAPMIRSAGFLVPDEELRLVAAPTMSGATTTGEPPLGPVVLRSILVGLLAVLLATLPAVTLGRWLARTRSPARAPVGAVLLLPLVLPPVVTGFLLLAVFGSSGLLGPLLAQFGLRLSFSFWAAVVAAAVVGFPLYAVVVRNAFESVDPRYEELAWTLGARPRSTFRRVALPLALPGVAAGAVLALARGLGEFGATIVVAGNIEGETQTLALAVYRLLESPAGRGRIWLFVLASAAIAVLGLALWEWLTARQRARLLDGAGR